jgi:hypothetical protein
MRVAMLALAAHLPTGALAQDVFQFQSPTGNIHCVMVGGQFGETPGARCDLVELTPTYAENTGCDGNWGDAFFVGLEGKAVPVCYSDSDSVVDRDSPILQYGETMTKGIMSCRSQKTGVTCTNGQGHGFTVSKAAQRLF